MKKLLIITLCLILLCFSCLSRKEKYSQKVNSYQTLSASTVVADWGYPDETTLAPNGNKLLVYYDQKTVIKNHYQYDKTRPKNMKYYATPYTDSVSCKTFFEIDKSGMVVGTSSRGEGCR